MLLQKYTARVLEWVSFQHTSCYSTEAQQCWENAGPTEGQKDAENATQWFVDCWLLLSLHTISNMYPDSMPSATLGRPVSDTDHSALLIFFPAMCLKWNNSVWQWENITHRQLRYVTLYYNAYIYIYIYIFFVVWRSRLCLQLMLWIFVIYWILYYKIRLTFYEWVLLQVSIILVFSQLLTYLSAYDDV